MRRKGEQAYDAMERCYTYLRFQSSEGPLCSYLEDDKGI